jgi:hypothetical protein
MERCPIEKLILQLVGKFSRVMKPESTMPCSEGPATFLSPESDQFDFLKSILILHLRAGLRSELLSSGFANKSVYKFRFSHIRATCPFLLSLPDWSTHASKILPPESLCNFTSCLLKSLLNHKPCFLILTVPGK